jgi:hypothetical protein
MRKTNFADIAAGALILTGIAGWVFYPSHRPLEAKASTSIDAQIDTFGVMSAAKDLIGECLQ